MGNSALPDHLKGKKHTDFPKFLQWVPCSWTSYLCVQPPVLLWGNQKNFEEFQMFHGNSYLYDPIAVDFGKEYLWSRHWNGKLTGPSPIPDPLLNPCGYSWGIYGVQLRRWIPILPLGFAFSTRWGIHRIHFRIGFRWDNVDSYFTAPTLELSVKKKYG